MRRNSKIRWFGRAAALGFVLAATALTANPAGADVIQVSSPGYGSQYYYPGTVVSQPLLLPRTGSNDYLYTYDNVYGAGASAAGRMDRVVQNPQPQLYIPRQQPRVYLGY